MHVKLNKRMHKETGKEKEEAKEKENKENA